MKVDDRCLLFFIKYPEKGKVKTRLAAVIGDEMAVKVYKRFILAMLSTLKKGNFSFYLCFYPENSLENLREWLSGQYHYLSQRGEDLGERMKHSFLDAFNLGFKRVVLIGSDIPDLPLEMIEEAFTALQEKDAVIGPTHDGGYYLIGFTDKTFSPQIFEGIPWSTERVFEETIKVLGRENHSVHPLRVWRDIDTIEDLKNFAQLLPTGHLTD